MDIERFYIEKRDNFVCFISELRAEWPCGLSLREPGSSLQLRLSEPGFYNISPDLDFALFQGYKILLKAAIASGTVDSYVEKFLVEDGINVERLPAYRLAKIKRYLKMSKEIKHCRIELEILESLWRSSS